MPKQTLILIRDGLPIENSVQDALKEHFELQILPLLPQVIHQIKKSKARYILFSDNSANTSTGINLLKRCKHQFPKSLIMYQAKTPGTEFILEVFRSGANDVIIGPLSLEKLQSCFDRLRTSYPSTPSLLAKRSAFHPSLIYTCINWIKNAWARKWQNQEYVPRHHMLYSFPILEKQVFIPQEKQISESVDVLRVRMFGSFQASINGTSIDQYLNKKNKTLFSYLLFHHQKRIPSEHLMELFWPNTLHDSAKNNLRVAIHSIRKAVQKVEKSFSLILFQNDCYYLNPEIEMHLDVAEFLDLWKKGRLAEHQDSSVEMILAYSKAVAYYQGDLIEEQLYEAWTQTERGNLKEILLVLLERLSEYYEEQSCWREVESYCKQILEKDNCRESIHRRLMRCYYHLGYRCRALKQYHACKRVLEEELEAEPSRATLHLFDQIKEDTL